MAAPAEATVLAAFKKVQQFSGKELDQRITDDVGNPMLGAFKALATATVGKENNEQVNRIVHLMVLAYLMNSEVRNNPTP